MSRQVNLGQIVPNIQIGTTTTSSPGSSASVENVGTSLNPILNFTIPKGDSGSIKFIIVETLPSENIDESAIYLTPSENPDLKNHYDEWIWVVNRFEPLGETQIEVDLTDYVKNIDYATSSKGGVIKIGGAYGTQVNASGILYPTKVEYSNYNNMSDYAFIGKGTLENAITGKGLVSNTDYASESVGGVIKTDWGTGTYMSNGKIQARVADYATYSVLGAGTFIGKGTLENVLTARIGDIQTLLDDLDSGSGV